MTEEQRLAELADECVERLLAGEAPGDILRAYPEDAEALRPVLESAFRLHMPVPQASAAARSQAMNSMMSTVEQERERAAGRLATAGGLGAMIGWFSRQPLVYKGLAAVAGVVMLGGVAAGASAGGATPKPVQELFGFSANSSIRVEFEGVIRGMDAANNALTVEAGDDVRTVIVDDATELEDDNDDLTFVAVGDLVKVVGSLQPDNTILADSLERVDDDDATPSPTNDFDQTPTVEPGEPRPTETADDADGDDDDNSGPGNGDDDDPQPTSTAGHDDDRDDDDDNSGPGNGDDDDPQPTSTAGHDDDRDDDDDNSGPGSGDDDDDDNSGSGSGNDDDDNSGSGSGDDSDDNSGSGSGDDDD